VTEADYEAAAIELAALKKDSEKPKDENFQVSLDYLDDEPKKGNGTINDEVVDEESAESENKQG
jgi:hypothetical protein